jgi:hypothetical protein
MRGSCKSRRDALMIRRNVYRKRINDLRKPMLFVLTALTVPATAGATQLDIKTGQWEMTESVHMQGFVFPPEELAKLPPEARAQIEGAMQSAQQPHTNKSCMTEEKLRRGFDLGDQTHGQCHQDVVNLSSTSMEVRGVCKARDGVSSLHAVFTAVNRDTIHGQIDADRAGGAGPQHFTVTIDGRWLGPTCDGSEANH